MHFINELRSIVLVVFLFSIPLFPQQSLGVYDFPIKPGTAEWRKFTSHDQMIAACQIPEATLKNMSTKQLVETCLNYPLYKDMFFFDQVQTGFEAVTKNFNGLRELLKRNDAGTIVLEKYIKMNPGEFDKNWSTQKKGELASKFYSVEILISQEAILSTLKKTQKKSLLEECIKKAQLKSKFPECYGMWSLQNIGLIAGRIMLNENFSNITQRINTDEKMEKFLKNGTKTSRKIIDDLMNYSIQYLNEN